VIEEILGDPVATWESFGDYPDVTLFPEEYAIVARAAEARRKEFATARVCARAALAKLGQPAVPLLPGPGGAPRWPEGVTGSITHCPGYRAAAVALTRDIASLGLDAEPNEPLPNHGMLEIVAGESERSCLADLASSVLGVCWDRLLFSVKESVYKAWFPLAQRWLGFESVCVDFDADAGRFTARLLVEGPLVGGSTLSLLHGRWLAGNGWLLTAVVVPA
jgi:enterobactin synthetase component D / holo-[acyl-carrier protein] synthase